MNKELELMPANRSAPVVAIETKKPQRSVGDLLEMVVERGLTAENVAAFKDLVQLHREEVKLNAEREFASAFIVLLKELPTIVGVRPIPDKHGNVKFRYANFEDIDEIVRPICLRNGFSYAFRETGMEAGRVTVTMTLQHSGGHSREIPYTVRIGSGPPGANESQADGSGHTYGKRGAIESGLSLRIVGAREDATMEGDFISKEQAFELERRVAETNSNKEAFLKFAGAAKFEEIRAGKYDTLDSFLRRKENPK